MAHSDPIISVVKKGWAVKNRLSDLRTVEPGLIEAQSKSVREEIMDVLTTSLDWGWSFTDECWVHSSIWP